jgi:hypothetical protein
MMVLTGTGEVALAKPIIFTRDENCKFLIEPIAEMYMEGATMLRLRADAKNASNGNLTISCGSETSIIIHITTYIIEQ